MANDHYIPRFLTSRWERQGGKKNRWFWYFDLETLNFGEAPSLTCFAQKGLNEPELETLYRDFIETPFGAFLYKQPKRIVFGRPTQLTWPEQRAFLLLWLLSSVRLREAQGLRDEQKLTAENCEQFAQVLAASHEIISYFLPTNVFPLFFADTVHVPVPIPGQQPAMVVPVSPRQVVAVIPRGVSLRPGEWLHDALGLLPAFSVGVGTKTRKLLVPPELHDAASQQSEQLKEKILSLRSDAHNIVHSVAEASAIAGLPAWKWGEDTREAR